VVTIKDDASKSPQANQDMKDFLIFIAIVCVGDYNMMTATSSYLAWIKEWFLIVR